MALAGIVMESKPSIPAGGSKDGRTYIVVHPSTQKRMLDAAIRCLRRLLPGAELVVAPLRPPMEPGVAVVEVRPEDLVDGPLAAAAALQRRTLPQK